MQQAFSGYGDFTVVQRYPLPEARRRVFRASDVIRGVGEIQSSTQPRAMLQAGMYAAGALASSHSTSMAGIILYKNCLASVAIASLDKQACITPGSAGGLSYELVGQLYFDLKVPQDLNAFATCLISVLKGTER